MSNTGTLRKCTLDGVSYDVAADTNVSFKPSKYEVEGIPTSGKTMMKMTKVVPMKENLGLIVTPAEAMALKAKAESLADITMSIEYADGSVFKSTGRISFDTWESETGKANLKLIPVDDWTPFLA